MKIVYIICINISENFEGNVNFEYLVKGDYMMTRYILKRLGYMVLSLFIIITITFFLMKMMPGSPFNDAKLSAEQKAILNEKYGLNDPVAVQYLHYLKNVVTGDFGYSFQYHNQPVWSLIRPRLIPSMEMGITAMIIGVILGLILGVAASYETKHLGRLYNYCYFSYSSISTFIRLSSTITIRFCSTFKMVSSSRMGRIFNSSIAFLSIISKCNGHSSSLYSS